MKTYWHFAAMKDGRPVMRDGTPIEIGKRYEVPEAVMCKRGYHGSPTPLDALQYAPGAWVSKREIDVTNRQDDKVVGTSCRHIVGADATEVLRKFARMCALDVIHLWNAPDVVVRYLRTGEEELRAAAHAAAQATAWDGARATAQATAQATAWDGARATAGYASWDAAWTAAGDAAWAKQNKRLTRMLNTLLRENKDDVRRSN